MATSPVVGVPHDDEVHFDAGAVYVFLYDGAEWTQAAKLMASDGRYQDQFGTSVAVRGDVIAVGAPLVNPDTDEPDTGAVYVFRRDGASWIEEDKLERPDDFQTVVEFARLGASVAIGDDVIVAGAWGDREDRYGEFAFGSASVFHYDGLAWSEAGPLDAQRRRGL